VISNGVIHHFDGRNFNGAKPNAGGQINYGWGWNQITFQDRGGEWWVSSTQGLYRFPATSKVEQLSHQHAKLVYTTREGLPNNEIFRLYEDSRGDIWITTIGANPLTLARWERETDRFRQYGEADGLPLRNGPTVFREDRLGNLWIGFYEGGLARHRDGKFTLLTAADGLPEGMIRDLYLDHSGHLWIATSRGVARAENLDAERPRITTYTSADGLASNQTTCVTEDQQGRIYIGTPKGVDRLNTATGQFKHYSTADGLANNFVNVAYCDHQGRLWFGTLQGLSRLLPEPENSSAPPSILISRLRIAGEDYSVSALGQMEIAGPELSAHQNDLQIDYSGVSVGAADSLRYQYKLEGADRDWSAPTTQRSITYARLSPGAYRFLVRAISTDGIASAQPAFVSFTILRPIWQRWWFLSLIGLLVAGAAYVVHKYRVNQLLELERVRTRIATDLHDDIGASLSQIAILSEVASQKIELGDNRVNEPLKLIAGNSRELVDSMSDIVWAINPKRDRVRDLSQRMRRFASDMFTARNIELQFHGPNERQDLRVGTEVRRQVFLIFKESVNNAVRHSGCTRAEVDLRIEGNTLTLRVSDNGKGFRENGESNGHGLTSMRDRAMELGGSLEITSVNSDGTTVLLRVPIDGHHLWRRPKVTT
jgi:two-component sensor histidine kinase/sugar lactone lactonase YvrE